MRLVGAELLKLVTAYRTILGIVLAQTAIVLLGTIVTVYDVANDPALPQNFGRDLVGIAGTSLLFTTLLGVLIATTEYRHGTITLTFLATPVRAGACGQDCGGAHRERTPRAACARSLRWDRDRLGRQQVRLRVRRRQWELVGRLFLGAAMVAIIGLFIGATLTRQLGAIILILGWLFFAEPALANLEPETEDYLAGPALGESLAATKPPPRSAAHCRSWLPTSSLSAPWRRIHEAPRHHVARGPLTRMRVGAGRYPRRSLTPRMPTFVSSFVV